MTLKQLRLTILLITVILTNSILNSMEESNSDKKDAIEKDTYLFEQLPDELILPIFCYKIQSIIDSYEPAQAKKEFESLLVSHCLAKKRFDEFKEELKKYFEMHKQLEISDVAFVKTPYRLSFKIGSTDFLIEKDNKKSITDFVQEIINVDDQALQKISEDIIEKVKSTGDEDEQRQALEALFAMVFYVPYDAAKETGNIAAENKIITLVKPIFKAYPDKTNTIYPNNLEEFGLVITDII